MDEIQKLLSIAVERKASDLHIIAEYSPSIRIYGDMYQLTSIPPLSVDQVNTLLLPLLSEKQKDHLYSNLELDFGIQTTNGARFRANFYFQKRSLGATFRHVSNYIKTIEELALPPTFANITKHRQGLVLFTGPTGEGKSTSLAALINSINLNTTKHIITIEDPIEYVFPIAKSIVSQRELGLDTQSWTNALRACLRQDPDVILLGEMRDYETIAAALTAAETGHLVFSTLHTSSTSETINRIIDVFPTSQQAQIRSQLASVLKVTVAQKLVASLNPAMPQVPAVEVLQTTQAAAALIREGKAFMLDSLLETGDEYGMILLEKYLAKLVREGTISKEVAVEASVRPQVLNKYITL